MANDKNVCTIQNGYRLFVRLIDISVSFIHVHFNRANVFPSSSSFRFASSSSKFNECFHPFFFLSFFQILSQSNTFNLFENQLIWKKKRCVSVFFFFFFWNEERKEEKMRRFLTEKLNDFRTMKLKIRWNVSMCFVRFIWTTYMAHSVHVHFKTRNSSLIATEL